MLIQTLQLAEFRPQHDGHFADEDALGRVLSEDFLFFAFALTGFGIVDEEVVQDFLTISNIGINLRTIRQIPHPRMMRKNRRHPIILLRDARLRVHVHLSELYLVDDIAILAAIACRVFRPVFFTDGVLGD